MMVGLGFIVNSSEVSKNLKGYMSNFNSRWDKAIATCQKKPDVMFIDVFTPEGTYARGMAQYGG